MYVTKEFISKTTLSVIPACLESFLKKDAGQASMTEYLYACDFTYGLISINKEIFNKIYSQAEKVSKLTSGLINYLLKRGKNK